MEAMRTECGTVSAIAGIFKAPLDILADKLRGYYGLAFDLMERPEKVLAGLTRLRRMLFAQVIGDAVVVIERSVGRLLKDKPLAASIKRSQLQTSKGMPQELINAVLASLQAEGRVELVQRTREDHRVITGASPRGSQSLFKTSRASAAIDGRDYVIPDDIKNVALEVISHRIFLKPESKIRGVTGRHITRKILSEVPVPVIQ